MFESIIILKICIRFTQKIATFPKFILFEKIVLHSFSKRNLCVCARACVHISGSR